MHKHTNNLLNQDFRYEPRSSCRFSSIMAQGTDLCDLFNLFKEKHPARESHVDVDLNTARRYSQAGPMASAPDSVPDGQSASEAMEMSNLRLQHDQWSFRSRDFSESSAQYHAHATRRGEQNVLTMGEKSFAGASDRQENRSRQRSLGINMMPTKRPRKMKMACGGAGTEDQCINIVELPTQLMAESDDENIKAGNVGGRPDTPFRRGQVAYTDVRIKPSQSATQSERISSNVPVQYVVLPPASASPRGSNVLVPAESFRGHSDREESSPKEFSKLK